MAGSTLGPAGAAIGTGHSSLAGYNGSAHNLHSSVANLNTNGALAARGKWQRATFDVLTSLTN